MSKNGGAPTGPPQYIYVPPQQAPPSYQEALGGVKPVGPFVPNNQFHSTQTSQHILTTVVPIGRQSTHLVCPSCNAEIETTTRTEPGLIAYLSGMVIALLGCFWGCCLIPCCIDDCMDVHHTCPNCKAYLGRYRR